MPPDVDLWGIDRYRSISTAHKLVIHEANATRLRAAVALRRGEVTLAQELCGLAIAQQRRTGCVVDLERSLLVLADVLAHAGRQKESMAAKAEAASFEPSIPGGQPAGIEVLGCMAQCPLHYCGKWEERAPCDF